MVTQQIEVTIRNAAVEEMDTVIHIFNVGFEKDPFFRWLVPNPEQRGAIRDNFFRLHTKIAYNKGTVLIAEVPDLGAVGVYITYPNGSFVDENYAEMDVVTHECRERYGLAVEAFDRHYPPVENFEYLLYMAILPNAHNYGIGSALLAHRFRDLDARGIPSYCEAVSRRVAGGLCGRSGFQPIGDPIILDDNVSMYPMWRPAPSKQPFPQINCLKSDDEHIAVGSVVTFANHEWRVLEVQATKVLLLSEKILACRPFHDRFEDISWADCELREYLNNDFYGSLDAESQSKIVETRVPGYKNSWFGTNAGDDTIDKIFLLSAEDVVTYFGDSKQLWNKNPNSKFYISDHFNAVRKAVDLSGTPRWWWLRTPGNVPSLAAGVSDDGRIVMSGDFVNRSPDFGKGVRPVLWFAV